MRPHAYARSEESENLVNDLCSFICSAKVEKNVQEYLNWYRKEAARENRELIKNDQVVQNYGSIHACELTKMRCASAGLYVRQELQPVPCTCGAVHRRSVVVGAQLHWQDHAVTRPEWCCRLARSSQSPAAAALRGSAPSRAPPAAP